jgi:type II secretory pathway pseudopilin PulG
MDRLVLHNKNGMTLIEVMIALLILMVVALAVMQTALVGMRVNTQNSLRDEAVNIVDLRMNELRNTAFDSISLGTTIEPAISRTFRGGVTVNYTPTRTVSQIDTSGDTKQITVSVAWPYAGKTYTHSVTTIMRHE